jgi:hypothetical protein
MMIQRKQITQFIILTGLILTAVISCKYDEVLPKEPDPGYQASFSQDIIPIFNASCNQSGCHNGAGHQPDLRSFAAYESLWNGNYIDTLLPSQSQLYQWMSGAKGLPMPIEGANATYNAVVLQWIEQGALNN